MSLYGQFFRLSRAPIECADKPPSGLSLKLLDVIQHKRIQSLA